MPPQSPYTQTQKKQKKKLHPEPRVATSNIALTAPQPSQPSNTSSQPTPILLTSIEESESTVSDWIPSNTLPTTREEARRWNPPLWLGEYPPVPTLTSGTLHLSALAFLKLHHWRDCSSNEVACFGLSHPSHPLLMVDLFLMDQFVSSAYCEVHEDHFSHLIEALSSSGITPLRWLCNWFHTHPRGMGPTPSSKDVETFNSTRFSRLNHSMMVILGGNNQISCRLRVLPANPLFPPQITEAPVVVLPSYHPPVIDSTSWTAQHTALTYTENPDIQITGWSFPHGQTWTPDDEARWQERNQGNLLPNANHLLCNREKQLLLTENLTALAPYLNAVNPGYSGTQSRLRLTFSGRHELEDLFDLWMQHLDCKKHSVDLVANHLPLYADLLLNEKTYDDACLCFPYLLKTDRISILSLIRNKPQGTVSPLYLSYLENLMECEDPSEVTNPPEIREDLQDPQQQDTPPNAPSTSLGTATRIPPTDPRLWDLD